MMIRVSQNKYKKFKNASESLSFFKSIKTLILSIIFNQ